MSLRDDVRTIVKVLTPAAFTAAGAAIGGPWGASLGQLACDVVMRTISPMQKTRLALLLEYAAEEQERKVAAGAVASSERMSEEQFSEACEGILLSAMDSWENKKIPLLAKLLVTAEYTGTHISNVVQTLIYANQLSYRQLCILGAINNTMFRLREWNPAGVRLEMGDERVIGVMADVGYLKHNGLIANHHAALSGEPDTTIHVSGLTLMYTGVLLANGMQLGNIEDEEMDYIESLFFVR